MESQFYFWIYIHDMRIFCEKLSSERKIDLSNGIMVHGRWMEKAY